MNNLIDICPDQGIITFNNEELPKQLLLPYFNFDNPNQNARTALRINFQLNERQFQYKTRISIQLGFLNSPNSYLFNTQNPKCWVRETDVSRQWQYLTYVSQTKSLELALKVQQNYGIIFQDSKFDDPNTSKAIYQVQCVGLKVPDGLITDSLKISWVDEANFESPIQSSLPVDISSQEFKQDIQFKIPLQLYKKEFNCQGFESFYTFKFTPSRTNITYAGRIYLEFSSGVSPKLNRDGQSIFCAINGTKVDCEFDRIIPRRLVILAQSSTKARLKPNLIYFLTIGGILQPKLIDSYGKIWMGIDLDNDLQNGLNEHGEVIDIALQTFQPSILSPVGVSFNKFIIRQNKLFLRINFTFPIRTVSQDKILMIQFNEAFSISQNTISEIECRLYRINDDSKYNFSSKCSFYYDRFIKIQMSNDPYNVRLTGTYQLEIRSLRSPNFPHFPKQNPMLSLFPEKIEIFLTDKQLSNVLIKVPQLAQIKPKPFLFTYPPDQPQLFWYIYDSKSKKYSLLQSQIGISKYPTFKVLKGAFTNTYLFLGLQNPLDRFKFNINLKIVDESIYNHFIIYGKSCIFQRLYQLIFYFYREFSFSSIDQNQNIIIYQGDSGYWFQIAAKDTIGSGSFIINFSTEISKPRLTSWGKQENTFSSLFEIPLYSDVPQLRLQVTSKKCKIFYQQQYTIPVNGQTNPVIFKFACSPVSEVSITPKYDNLELLIHESVVIGKEISNKKKIFQVVSNLNIESRAEFIFKINGGVVGQIINIQLVINDPDNFIFQNKGLLQLKIVKNTQTIEVKANDVILAKNIATFQCAKVGQLVWTIGHMNSGNWRISNIKDIYLSLNNQIIQEIENELIEEKINNAYLNKLVQTLEQANNQNFQLINDLQTIYEYKSFFGSLEDQLNFRISKRHIISNVNELVKIKFINLGHKIDYKIEYFCMDQLNQKSDIKSAQLTVTATKDQLDLMPKNVYLKFYFQRSLTFQQQNNLLCSISEMLFLKSYQITDIKCNQCDQDLLSYEKKRWANLLSTNETIAGIYETPKTIDELNDFIVFLSIQGYPNTNGEQFNPVEEINGEIKKIQDEFKLKNTKTDTTTPSDSNTQIPTTPVIIIFINLEKEMPVDEARRQFGLKICNITDDPEIAFIYKNIEITNSSIYNGNYLQAQNIITLSFQNNSNSTNLTNISNSEQIITLTAQSTAEAFIFGAYFGEQEKQMILDQAYLPSPLQLRRGMMGDGTKINTFFSAYVNGQKKIKLSKIQEKNSYLIWTSYPKGAHCLSDQYQDTQILQIPDPIVQITYSYFGSMAFVILMMIN